MSKSDMGLLRQQMKNILSGRQTVFGMYAPANFGLGLELLVRMASQNHSSLV
jgi:hypothetical protein